mgnify:CR=1 FL=1|tara:strand:+ start:1992 stop:2237 length:246 start_codon:yes stop_codon:yes gene_type:complete
MPRIAWAKNLVSAYNAVIKGDRVYNVGEATGVYGRPTATSSGLVHLTTNKWISGYVEKKMITGLVLHVYQTKYFYYPLLFL